MHIPVFVVFIDNRLRHCFIRFRFFLQDFIRLSEKLSCWRKKISFSLEDEFNLFVTTTLKTSTESENGNTPKQSGPVRLQPFFKITEV